MVAWNTTGIDKLLKKGLARVRPVREDATPQWGQKNYEFLYPYDFTSYFLLTESSNYFRNYGSIFFCKFFVCFNLIKAVFSTKASSIEINNTFWENSRWIASELVAGFREQDSKKIRLRSQKAVGPTVSSNAHFHLIWHVTKLYACSFPSEIRLQLRFCFHDWEISWLVEHGDICRKLLRWKQKGDVR